MTHASIFSGIGGAELAAAWMGWTNLFHCEIQDFPRQVLDYWFPDSISYGDITTTNFEKWKGKVDVLTGGFPCQPFSVSGSRKGKEDDRYLWTEMLRAVREIQPTWVVAENVNGIRTMVEPCSEVKVGRSDNIFEESYIYREEYKFTIERICEDFEREGYSVQPIIIPACAVGAPHRRDRIWIIAHASNTRIEEVWQNRQDGVFSVEATSYTNDCRSRQVYEEVQSKKSDGAKFNRIGSKRHAAKKVRKRFRGGCDAFKGFPKSQPTICRGDDGLPFNVDHLTISERRWRKESIKAYGNAWVPQIAFEIFKAIEKSTYKLI